MSNINLFIYGYLNVNSKTFKYWKILKKLEKLLDIVQTFN